MTPWRYAASPINWCNDDLMDLGDHYQLDEIWRDMQRVGITGTEMGRKYPKDPQVLAAGLNEYGLRLVSAWTTVHLSQAAQHPAELERFRAHATFLTAMGAKVVVTAEGSGSIHWDLEGDRPRKIGWSDQEWEAVAAGLNRAGSLCQEMGLALVYHPHLGTNIETPEDIERLMQMTDPERVRLLLDTGHVYAAGGDPAEVARRYSQRIDHVHLKDVRQTGLEWYRAHDQDFLGAVRRGLFTVPGDGVIDFGETLEIFRRVGYEGWMVIEAEQDPVEHPPRLLMEQALQYLSGRGGEALGSH